MNVDPAITQAVESALAEASGQTEEFGKKFRNLVKLVLEANYQDSDVRRVMDAINVALGTDS